VLDLRQRSLPRSGLPRVFVRALACISMQTPGQHVFCRAICSRDDRLGGAQARRYQAPLAAARLFRLCAQEPPASIACARPRRYKRASRTMPQAGGGAGGALSVDTRDTQWPACTMHAHVSRCPPGREPGRSASRECGRQPPAADTVSGVMGWESTRKSREGGRDANFDRAPARYSVTATRAPPAARTTATEADPTGRPPLFIASCSKVRVWPAPESLDCAQPGFCSRRACDRDDGGHLRTSRESILRCCVCLLRAPSASDQVCIALRGGRPQARSGIQ